MSDTYGGYTVEDIMASDINRFIEAMADAVKSVIDYKKGKMVYISVMKDISIDCDCDVKPTSRNEGHWYTGFHRSSCPRPSLC